MLRNNGALRLKIYWKKGRFVHLLEWQLEKRKPNSMMSAIHLKILDLQTRISDEYQIPTTDCCCVNIPGSVCPSELIKTLRAADNVSNLIWVHDHPNSKCPRPKWDSAAGLSNITLEVTKQRKTSNLRVTDLKLHDSTYITLAIKIALLPTPTTKNPVLWLGTVEKVFNTVHHTH